MRNEIIFNNVTFWLNQDVIHCRFHGKIDKRFLHFEVEHIFVEVISSYSKSNYKPIIIDLTRVSMNHAFCLYKFISLNERIESCVISKSFLVNQLSTKLLFKLFSVLKNDRIVPVKISTNFRNAVQYSNEKFIEFYAI